jgi:hypothetical protein
MKRVAARLQIEDEVIEDYAEMAASHPQPNEPFAKDVFDHGESRNPRVSKISPRFLYQLARKRKTLKSQPPKCSTPHN